MGAPSPATEAGFYFDVGDGHQLWVSTCGDATGIPALFLHGGPGGGFQPSNANLFDPQRFFTVLFDQRGAGRSTPRRGLQANTTAHLIADIERLREHFGVEKWLVVGGSWGATLALAYAQSHRERVTGLVLRAVFLGTAGELDWAFGTGLRTFYPALYEDFIAALPEPDRANPLPSYYRRILDPDPAIHAPAALAWHDTERVLSEVAPTQTRLNIVPNHSLPNSPFIEAHYFQNSCFLGQKGLLENVGRLHGIPGVMVQGRYDLLCPPATSFALANLWPQAEIVVAEMSGHSLQHPAVHQQVKEAISRFDGNRFALA